MHEKFFDNEQLGDVISHTYRCSVPRKLKQYNSK